MPVTRFMHGYWGRKPLLIRNALRDFRCPLMRSELFALAARDEVESRLVTAFGGQWELRHGPFARRALPSLKRSDWTLLVQGVDLEHAGAHTLLSRFRFVPDARLDDLMASYATAGGGVGPHVDSYDVFLLQAHGRRRWRISRQRDLRLEPDLPLKILSNFRPSQEWVLEPGDMLYLPPGVAHEGVALDECITLSIGFRAPAWQELVEPWFSHLGEQVRLAGRYADRDNSPTLRPARIPAALLRETRQRLGRLRPTADHASRVLLATLSEPKAQVTFGPPPSPLSLEQFGRRLGGEGALLVLDQRTRLLYAGGLIGINGEVHARPPNSDALLALADRRAVPAEKVGRGRIVKLLHEWYVAGWLHLANAATDDTR